MRMPKGFLKTVRSGSRAIMVRAAAASAASTIIFRQSASPSAHPAQSPFNDGGSLCRGLKAGCRVRQKSGHLRLG